MQLSQPPDSLCWVGVRRCLNNPTPLLGPLLDIHQDKPTPVSKTGETRSFLVGIASRIDRSTLAGLRGIRGPSGAHF